MLFFGVAMAIDYGFGSNAKLRQQKALDAATLAAAEQLGVDDQETKITNTAMLF